MATGTYGTVRPADVSPEDVEIILNFTPSRDETDNFVLTKLDAPSILRPYFNNANTGGNANVEILGGLYNLKLPADQFNKIGIYTLLIRPAQIRTTVLDCGGTEFKSITIPLTLGNADKTPQSNTVVLI